MKLQFDPNQAYQLGAVAAITDLFDGQPQGPPEYSIIDMGQWGGMFAGQQQTELGVGNGILLAADKLLSNARSVQARNDIDVLDASKPLDAWDLFDAPANTQRSCPHFSVEMETGTGKTYVYLRTIFELSRRYDFQKFIIVVPSVAIREGVLKNIEITGEHFRALYNNIPFEHFVYDGKKVNRLRQFAVSNTLQILIINIDAFRKNFTGTEAEQKSHIIYKESDKLSGRQPIEFVQAARPIVIIDEPQSVDSTEKAQDAIRALNPLCTVRYSATHRNPYNLVYRVDPIKAFELRLVKQIVVAGTRADGGANDAFVRVEGIDYKKRIKAKLRIHVQTPEGPKEKSIAVKNGADLYQLSNERAAYENGHVIAEINAEPSNEYIRFNNGRMLRLGEEAGGMRGDVWKVQIRETVERHLKKEVLLRDRGIKVLSLFFIDRVANYRDYDAAGQPVKGKFAVEIEAALAEFAKNKEYASIEWLQKPVEAVHDGYFASDKPKKGQTPVWKDTRGDTQADDDVYNLIMREKERLLSEDEPLRFIFSHSALREGWDNPNVFQICTLNETHSALKKRQEIGRGLRLPVDRNGQRVVDASINKLFVMANESYADFARALQTEYEEECGVTFGKVPLTAIARLFRIVDGKEEMIGRTAAETIRESLVKQKMLDTEGRIQPAFDPKKPGFTIVLPEEHKDLAPAIIDLLANYQIERFIRKEKDEGPNRLRKEVLSPEFKALWDHIKLRTTYRVEFDTNTLVSRAVDAIKRMEKIEAPKVTISVGQLEVTRGGIATRAISDAAKEVSAESFPIPDVLGYIYKTKYLQNETELTRSTLVRILKESERLKDFFTDPQRFMDAAAHILKYELHRLLVDGIKYERIVGTGTEAEWEMMLFKNEELVSYLTALQVQHSVYEYVGYESEVEREFARKLDQRDDIKLFVKLPWRSPRNGMAGEARGETAHGKRGSRLLQLGSCA